MARTRFRAFPAIDPATFFRRVDEENPILDAKRFHLYASGRAALFHGALCLKQQGIRLIYAPVYHCGVEIEALLRAGLAVRFYPLDDKLNCDLPWLIKNIDAKKAALLIVHYFGFPQPLEAIMALCREKGMLLVEDCAHALYSSWQNQMLGTFGDMAIFSLQKTIPLPNGGGLLINNGSIGNPFPGKPCTDGVLWKILVRSMLDFQADKDGAGAATAKGVIALYSRLFEDGAEQRRENHCAVEEDEAPGYYDVAHQDYEKGLFSLAKKILRPAPHQEIVRSRRENYRCLERAFSSFPAFAKLFDSLPAGCCPLCFPIRVDDNDRWTVRLQALGIFPFVFGRFAHPLLQGSGQHDVRWQKSIIGLPVHQHLSIADCNTMVQLAVSASTAFSK